MTLFNEFPRSTYYAISGVSIEAAFRLIGVVVPFPVRKRLTGVECPGEIALCNMWIRN
jgi:hypothetical protein